MKEILYCAMHEPHILDKGQIKFFTMLAVFVCVKEMWP